MSETPLIHSRMGKVLAELPAIGKNQRNTQQNFMFRGIDDVLNALNPVLAKHGLFYTPEVLERVDEQRQTKAGALMYVVHLHVTFMFYAPDGSHVSATAWGEGMDSGDKATSKAMTMAQKSMLFQVFCISTEDQADPDGQTQEPTQPKPKQQGPVKPVGPASERVQQVAEKANEIATKRAQRLHIEAKEAGISEEKLRARIKTITGGEESAKALNDAQATALLQEIKRHREKKIAAVQEGDTA